MILNYIATYMLIGLVIGMFTEFGINRVEEYLTEQGEEDHIIPWGTKERIVTVVLWPYAIVLYILAIIKYITK